MAQRLIRLGFSAVLSSLSFAVWTSSSLRLVVAGEQDRPPVAKTDRVDNQGDPLPEDALVRIGSVRLRHAHNAKDVAFSPDGKILASVAYDHTVRLWDPATGKELRQLTTTDAERDSIHSPSRYLSRVVFSPDGQRVLASELYDGIRVWDSVTGKFLAHIQGANGVTGMAYSPEEFHVSLFVPQQLSAKEGAAIRRTLRSLSFARSLRQAVADVIENNRHLEAVVVKISR